MANNSLRALMSLSALATTCLLASCGDGIVVPALVNPRIEALEFAPFYSQMPDAGIVAVRARFVDTSARLQDHERIAIRVTVEGGDEETLGLRHSVCFLPSAYSCFSVSVGTRSGHTVDELTGVLAPFLARWWVIGVSRTNGGVWVFDPRRVPAVIAALRRHPAVASAERDGIGVPGVDPAPHLPSILLATLPLDLVSPTANDGRIQGQKGAIMTARYTQPDGSVLTHTWAIP